MLIMEQVCLFGQNPTMQVQAHARASEKKKRKRGGKIVFKANSAVRLSTSLFQHYEMCVWCVYVCVCVRERESVFLFALSK